MWVLLSECAKRGVNLNAARDINDSTASGEAGK